MLSLPHLPDATRNRISGLFATSTAHHKRESSWCTTTMTSLHSLRTYGRRLSDIPVSRLPNVTELEIKYLNTSNGYAGLGAALGELPQLRSLSLMNIQRSWVRTNVFSEVASAMPLLPNLSALAINHTYCLDRFPPSTVPLFCKILRGHAKLRRVYWNYALDSSDLVTYMEMIATHTDLEAFHISVWDGLTDSLLSFVCRHLSPQLSILSLSSVRNGCSDDRTIFSGLWTYFTDLSFLSVQIHGGLNTAVTVQDVIRGARRVQVVGLEVGYVGQFREVIYPNGEPVLLPAWPARKIKLYEIEDFGCESWDWFMRHHLF
ncbi:uncharacterized protein B0H18DRAFT_1015680 [Fomitopsis serialis]|uniref:uncharacterized protein n=1 Tax=Fomitopsis serialis TaxID=139415 RepID=UPI002008538B|nr:uncharacterized protein B0H18DRAFT_1015680 [Neoantrodia serialis]KAH9923032.1 hypothetical protein B0H18DRAFT_1015680 [Neoantrodia serialis]